MGYWDWYPKAKPRRPANGIRAKTERGQFVKTWWAGRWIAALERLVDPGRLSRGRSYARSGQVLNLDIGPGRVDSRVQGSQPKPYRVHILIKPLSDREWAKVTQAMAAQAIFAAKLLAGEMPQNIEEAFQQAKASLFPAARADLETDCSCPDYANPCKHIAAVYYLLGEQFDEDPFLIFQLRGRSKSEIIAALRAARSVAEPEPDRAVVSSAAIPQPAESATPLANSLETFWEAPAEMENLPITLAPASINAAPVKRLGEPPFWPSRSARPPALLPQMEAAYCAIAEAAIRLSRGE
jgi:uncharacterized Zn finger protein